MLEKECDIVLKWLYDEKMKSSENILNGIDQSLILRSQELNKIPDFQKIVPPILSILLKDEYVELYNRDDKFYWNVSKRGVGAIFSADTYEKRKRKELIEDSFKIFQYKYRWIPYIMSFGALVCSVIALVKSYSTVQSGKQSGTVQIQQWINRSGTLHQSADTLYQTDLSKDTSKKKTGFLPK